MLGFYIVREKIERERERVAFETCFLAKNSTDEICFCGNMCEKFQKIFVQMCNGYLHCNANGEAMKMSITIPFCLTQPLDLKFGSIQRLIIN